MKNLLVSVSSLFLVILITNHNYFPTCHAHAVSSSEQPQQVHRILPLSVITDIDIRRNNDRNEIGRLYDEQRQRLLSEPPPQSTASDLTITHNDANHEMNVPTAEQMAQARRDAMAHIEQRQKTMISLIQQAMDMNTLTATGQTILSGLQQQINQPNPDLMASLSRQYQVIQQERILLQEELLLRRELHRIDEFQSLIVYLFAIDQSSFSYDAWMHNTTMLIEEALNDLVHRLDDYPWKKDDDRTIPFMETTANSTAAAITNDATWTHLSMLTYRLQSMDHFSFPFNIQFDVSRVDLHWIESIRQQSSQRLLQQVLLLRKVRDQEEDEEEREKEKEAENIRGKLLTELSVQRQCATLMELHTIRQATIYDYVFQKELAQTIRKIPTTMYGSSLSQPNAGAPATTVLQQELSFFFILGFIVLTTTFCGYCTMVMMKTRRM